MTVQAAAAKLFKDEVFPDMVARHRVAHRAGRRSRAALTLNSEFAAKFERSFENAFGGSGGAKLADMDGRCRAS